ncbi:helix-turn-helix transcriptional regulator [Streptomyces asoensis]|uniref:Helix-turn-helix transcriptional regulator n=1 Tax=Streptomyces asoensis TaxID=249586 RepID=A0A6M4X5R9_9ACTN|nr:TetR family transcriptional regulator [Streptomyces asoensis]QJT05546.1 helix-turn-helix transcriptional regulator [Streptomyces asoensis]
MRRSLEAALEVFAARGFKGTSIDTVAGHAGLGHQGAPAGPVTRTETGAST